MTSTCDTPAPREGTTVRCATPWEPQEGTWLAHLRAAQTDWLSEFMRKLLWWDEVPPLDQTRAAHDALVYGSTFIREHPDGRREHVPHPLSLRAHLRVPMPWEDEVSPHPGPEDVVGQVAERAWAEHHERSGAPSLAPAHPALWAPVPDHCTV